MIRVLLIPFTYFTHPPLTSPLVTICLFSIVKSLIFLFISFSLCSFVLFLKFLKFKKLYIYIYIYIYIIWFIYILPLLYPLSVTGHLDCFHNLAVVNNTVINIGMHIYFWISIFVLYFWISIFLFNGITDHMIILFFIFWGPSILFSTVTAPVCIPTNSARGFLSLHILTNIYCFFVFLILVSHSDKCDVISHCGFDLCFSGNEWCWASIHVSVGHLYVFFGETSC